MNDNTGYDMDIHPTREGGAAGGAHQFDDVDVDENGAAIHRPADVEELDDYPDSTAALSRDQQVYHTPFYKTKWFLAVAAVTFLAMIIGISVGAAGGKNKGGNNSSALQGARVPTIEIPQEEYQANKDSFLMTLESRYKATGLDAAAVNQENSPQNKALIFVTGRSTYKQLTDEQNIQRFSLASLYYATYAIPHPFITADAVMPWTSETNWVTNVDECMWEGITCDPTTKAVTAINLSKHDLTGSVPVELFLLNSLTTMDFTTNFIYMQGSDMELFSHLSSSVTTIMFDDNYLITSSGLPTQLSALPNLEKIMMSYNLLQGPFAGSMFTNLQALTHIEVESNYISGSLPTQMLQLPELTYLYMRRNSLTFAFQDIVQTGYLPSIFALWLDTNNISGSIPAAITQWTELASFSITNTTLGGPLPAEMGSLSNMKRCWLYNNELTGSIPSTLENWRQIQVLELYGNKLTGSMPQGVCVSVVASDYQYKTLSADCKEVQCDSCCTSCY